jgi:hypothetical protein
MIQLLALVSINRGLYIHFSSSVALLVACFNVFFKYCLLIFYSAQVQNRRQSLWNNNPEAIAKNLGLNEENVDKIAVQRGDSSCTKMECLESLPKFISSPPPPSPMEPDLEKFDGLKTFRLVY